MRRVVEAGIFSMVDVTLYQRLRKLGEPQRYDHTIYIVIKTKINTVGTTPK